jgi:hypothetical protein
VGAGVVLNPLFRKGVAALEVMWIVVDGSEGVAGARLKPLDDSPQHVDSGVLRDRIGRGATCAETGAVTNRKKAQALKL